MNNTEYKQTAKYKEYVKEYNKKWYLKHKSWKVSQSKESRIKMREFIDEQKILAGCTRCGFKEHPNALEFHHPEKDKIAPIGYLRTFASKEDILKEIKKCIVVCANCHRIIHAEEKLET